ncbi:MAG: hypothetical protein ACF788_06310, partial [Novipirellula sp. JB048]
SGFVWIGLVFATIAYQCCPSLFADLVYTLRSTTADVLKQERVPITLYGITYLPLLGLLTAASFRLRQLGQMELSQPIQHFVSVVAVFLVAIATSDLVWGAFASPFWVSTANAVAFLFFAVAFADRRYVIGSLGCGIIAGVAAIPALRAMQWIELSPSWIPTLMAAVAASMTATRILDRLLNRIPVAASGSSLVQRSDGCDRNLTQITGCLLALVIAFAWVCESILHFVEPMSQASLITFGLLLAAFVLYTLRPPQYHSGLCVWGLLSYAAVRWAAGIGISVSDGLIAATYIALGVSSAAYLFLRGSRSITPSASLAMLRNTLGFDSQRFTTISISSPASASGMRRVQAFVLPGFDLSFVVLSSLFVAVHIPLLSETHQLLLSGSVATIGATGVSTVLVCLWFVVARVQRRRSVATLATAIVPFVVTAVAISSNVGFPRGESAIAGLAVVWAIVQVGIWAITTTIAKRHTATPLTAVIQTVCEGWSLALVVLSCLSLDWSFRLVALIAFPVLCYRIRKQQDRKRMSVLAIMVNVHVLLMAASLAGVQGGWISNLMHGHLRVAIPFVFVTAAISTLVFDNTAGKLDPTLGRNWAATLRFGMVSLVLLSFSGIHYGFTATVMMTVGFALVVVAEMRQAIRDQDERRVWGSCFVAVTSASFLFHQGVITVGAGISLWVLLAIAITALVIDQCAVEHPRWSITRRH